MRIPGFCVVAAFAFAFATAALAQDPAFQHSFDGPQLAWQMIDGRANARLLSHGLSRDQVRQGTAAERLMVDLPGGEAMHFVLPVDRFPVMDEFEARIWLRASRPGARLAARVVLPRTRAKISDSAMSLFVFGDECKSPDRWQQLRIAQLPDLLAAQVRVVRASQRASIDSREAYVDAIVLVVPGGEDRATVWTDLLEIDGVVLAATAGNANGADVQPAVFSAPSWPQTAQSPPTVAASSPDGAPAQFRGTTLLVSGRPMLVRGIEWNNEPFAFLGARGFNTIWLDNPPTAEQAADAARENLWLVCRPPTFEKLAANGIGETCQRVLAWNLGSPQGPQDLDHFRNWASALREHDDLSRPILFAPHGDWLPASQLADALVAEHAAAPYIAKRSYLEWLESRPLLARPGTPIWANIATEAGPKLRQQSARLHPSTARVPTVLGDRQFADQILAATTSGCRGLVYRSDSPLDATDPFTRRRAALVEQWNDRLELIEPWLTIGKRVGDAASTDGSLQGIVVQAERARLFLPTEFTPTASANANPRSTTSKIALVIPGVPVSNEAFTLSPAGFHALTSQRVAGGTKIELPRDFSGYVLLTEDAAVVNAYRQRVARGARRAAQVEYGLAAGQSQSLGEAARRLQGLGENTKAIDDAIGAADAELRTALASLQASNFDAAYRQSTRALQTLQAGSEATAQAVADGPAFDSVPHLEQPVPLIARASLDRQLTTLRAGDNQLVGGDFEDLGQLRAAGWQHVEDPIPGVQTSVQLSGHGPHEGRYSLQLQLRSDTTTPGPQLLARAPVWITSPPIRAEENQLLEISGWIRIAAPISGNVDALEIVDSLGGSELALRIRQTDGWQPFRLVRASKHTTDVTLTFALHGFGTVAIDNVMARTLAMPQVKRLPTVTFDRGPAFPNSARRPMSPQVVPR